MVTEVATARDQAIEQVERHNRAWIANAIDILEQLAQRRPWLTTDDLWERIPGGDQTLGDPRAMGAVMRQAAALGLVVATPTHRPSKRRECHGRPIRVWATARGGQLQLL